MTAAETWRSLLYVPADSARFVASAIRSEADAVVLDLEDGLSPAARPTARRGLEAAVEAITASGRAALVRINTPILEATADLEAAVVAGVSAVVVAKTRGHDHLHLIGEAAATLATRRGVQVPGLVPLIETAQAVLRLEEIMAASGVIAGALGDEDLAADLDCDVGAGLRTARAALVTAAAARGRVPLGLTRTMTDYRDLDGLGGAARQARRLGFQGAFCIHPTQAPVLNVAFSPSASELERARAQLEAFEASAGGAIGHDGRMVDAPIARRARRVLARYRVSSP